MPIDVENEAGELLVMTTPERSRELYEVEASNEVEESIATPKRRSLVGTRSVIGMMLIGGVTLAAALFGRAAVKPRSKRWYRRLSKPAWTPPDKMFGLVWPVLYSLSAVSAYRVWRSPSSKMRSAALGLWAGQMATNAAWTKIFFGDRRPKAALVDLEANVASAAGYALTAGKIDRTAGLLMIPYVAWVSFAGALNASVAQRNA